MEPDAGILGPFVISATLNSILFGICIIQFYNYYSQRFPDKSWIQAMVGFLLVVDTTYSASVIYLLWQFTVTHFGDYSFLHVGPWAMTWTPLMTSLASLPVQHFLAHRIRIFTGSWLFFSIISFLSVSQALCGIGSTIGAIWLHDSTKFVKLMPIVVLWLVLAIICDAIITSILTYTLLKSRTGYESTDRIINRIVRLSVETAALGLLFALLDLLTFVFLPMTNIHCIFAFPMGRIYTNTILTTLNARAEHNQTSALGSTEPLTSFFCGPPPASFGLVSEPEHDPTRTTRPSAPKSSSTQTRSRSSQLPPAEFIEKTDVTKRRRSDIEAQVLSVDGKVQEEKG